METENTTKKIVFNMKQYWAEHDMSLADAARKLGISPQALSNRLTRPLNRKSALELASFWPWSVKFLLTGEGELEIKEKPVSGYDTQQGEDNTRVLCDSAGSYGRAPSTFELYDVIRQQADTIRSQQQLIRQLTERLTDNVPGTPIKKEELDILYRR